MVGCVDRVHDLGAYLSACTCMLHSASWVPAFDPSWQLTLLQLVTTLLAEFVGLAMEGALAAGLPLTHQRYRHLHAAHPFPALSPSPHFPSPCYAYA